MTANSTEEALSILRAQTEARRSQLRGGLAVVIGAGAGCAVLVLLFSLLKGGLDVSVVTTMFPSFICMVIAILAVSPKHKEAIRLALAKPDPLMTPHLLEVLDCEDEGLKKEVRGHLTELLPRITPEHRSAFDSRSRLLLATLLRAPEKGLRDSALDAIVAVGSLESLPYLDQAAKEMKGDSERVKAKEAAGLLRHRLAAQEIRGTDDPSPNRVRQDA